MWLKVSLGRDPATIYISGLRARRARSESKARDCATHVFHTISSGRCCEGSSYKPILHNVPGTPKRSRDCRASNTDTSSLNVYHSNRSTFRPLVLLQKPVRNLVTFSYGFTCEMAAMVTFSFNGQTLRQNSQTSHTQLVFVTQTQRRQSSISTPAFTLCTCRTSCVATRAYSFPSSEVDARFRVSNPDNARADMAGRTLKHAA